MDGGTYLEHYRVIVDATGAPVEVRGSGWAVTYKAQDVRSGEEVALEVIEAGDVSPEAFRELEEEVAGARELDHINLPKLHAFGRDEDRLIYASEYFDGTSTEDWVTAHGPMPRAPALRIGAQVVSALAAASLRGIVHGAINPRNILLVPGQTAQGDWPLVKVLGLVGPASNFTGSKFATAEPEFTTQFVSPEQLQNGTVDFRSEMYSLGATLCYLLTGAAPVGAGELPALSSPPRSVLQLLTQMLARNPDERPQGPVAFEARLRACLEQAERREAIERKFGAAVASSSSVAKKEKWALPPWRPLAMAAVAVLFAGTLAAVFWSASLRSGRLFGSHDESIGVSIGVPESSAPASTTLTSANSTIPASGVTQTIPAATGEVGAQQTIQLSRAPVVAEAKPAIVLQKVEIAAPPATAEQREVTPKSPGEGPEEETLRAEPVIAQGKQSAPRRAAPMAVSSSAGPAAVVPSAELSATEARRVARAAKRPRRINGLEVRAAEPVGEPAATGTKRARRPRFLGTTPDGELVFEIPGAPPHR